MMGDTELADTLVVMFMANMPGDIEKLKQAVAGGDGEQVHLAAHFIKGAATNLCASAISLAANEIEQAETQGSIGRANELTSVLDSSWKEFLKHPAVMRRLHTVTQLIIVTHFLGCG